MDDLMLMRRLKKEEHRRSEEERRRRRLEEAAEAPLANANVDTEIQEAAATTMIPKRQYQHRAEIRGRTGNLDAPSPHDTFFPPNKRSSFPQNVGFTLLKSSPSSSVSMSQSPAKAAVRTLTARKTTLFDSDDSSEEEDILESARRLERRKMERNKAARDEAVPVVEKTVSINAPQPVIHVRKKRFPVLDDSDSDGKDLTIAAQKLEQMRGQRQVAIGLSSSSADASRAPIAINDDTVVAISKTPRNPLALMREQNAADFNNLQPLAQTMSKEAVMQLWSDSEDETSSLQLSSKKKRTKNDDDRDVAETEHIAIMNNNKKRQRRLDMQQSKPDRHAIAPTILDTEDEENLRKQNKPEFDHPMFGPYNFPTPLVLGAGLSGDEGFQVPASITRYLLKHQLEGIEFLYKKAIVSGRGAILGDDMGLGKTVQTISLLAALYRKTGTGLDLLELSRRHKLVEARIARIQRQKDEALIEGRIGIEKKDDDNDFLRKLNLPVWSPVLIVAPNGVVTNWVDDFKTWSHFSVAVYQGSRREDALEKIENGTAEVLVCGQSMIQGKQGFLALNSLKVKWKLVIVDEFHTFKNENKQLASNLRAMRDTHQCVVVGLTGTVMQNNHKELWNLVDLAAKGHFGPWSQFELEYARPIMLSRTTDASPDAVKLGESKADELSTKLYEVYLRRTKDDVLADVLPTKDERIIFCEPSKLQKELYKYILDQPDFVLLRHKNSPCDCGVNRKFFAEYRNLSNKAERTNYQRKHRKDIIPRGKCCFPIPKIDRDGGEIDSGAVLWRQQHLNDLSCDGCPSCVLLPAMNILYKVSSHAALLQVKTLPVQFSIDSEQREQAKRKLEQARQFLPNYLIDQLPGGYVRESGMMNDHFGLSGKMVVVDKLLRAISTQQGRVLLFSHSTQALDLIENYVLSMGYSYLRMDGGTSQTKRDQIANQFRTSSTFIFLLSTKAMGLGLNLTQASFVILFDVDWNPANDSQAQDRAYRIGQKRNVKVFRLVSRGTIEELKYLRQVYKTQLQSETIVDVYNSDRKKASRLFRGVAGDESRKGELFGGENLLKFKDGTFMNYASRMSESRQYGVGVHDTSNLLDTVKNLTEEEFGDIGEDGNIFGDLARCMEQAAADGGDNEDRKNDWDGDDHLGGMSQAVMDIYEKGDLSLTEEQEAVVTKRNTEVESLSSELHRSKANDTIQPVNKGSYEHSSTVLPAADRSSRPLFEGDATKQQTSLNITATFNRNINEKKASYEITPSVREVCPATRRDINAGYHASEMPANALTDTFCSTRPRDAVEDLYSIETQSPVNMAVTSSRQINEEKQLVGKGLTRLLDKKLVGDNASAVAVQRQEKTRVATQKRALPSNTQMVGQTTDRIRRGETGPTTFSATDLFIPGGGRKTKAKKRSHS